MLEGKVFYVLSTDEAILQESSRQPREILASNWLAGGYVKPIVPALRWVSVTSVSNVSYGEKHRYWPGRGSNYGQ